MDEFKKAKLGEIISRTDKTGNEKLEMLVEFSQSYARQVAEQAVDVVMSQFTIESNRHYWYNEAIKETLFHINQLTEE